MFAVKPRTRYTVMIRVWLSAAILFNALVPSAALAQAASHEAAEPPALPGRKGSAAQSNALLSSRAAFQIATPTPTNTEAPTPEPSTTSTLTATLETTPSATQTQDPSQTAVSTSTQTSVASQPFLLSFKFTAAPEQATPGDEVTFTIEVTNQGQLPASGLLFSNLLPVEFGTGQSGFKDFNFDPQTRLLTWNGDQAGVTTLAPGQKLTLTYIVKVDAQLDEVQLIDSATFAAVGLSEPLLGESVLTILSSKKDMKMLDAKGGKADGLNGHIQVNLPENAINAPRGLLIQDLGDGLPGNADKVWLKFALEMRVPKPENAQPLREKDRIVPLESVEAQFDKPVEIAVLFDGLTDLSTMGADITPFLTTLDEASGTWVRVPLKTIDREANQITAEVTHFSVWGVGFGPSFPQDGAGVILFDDAYPALFTGTSRYSIPIWVPPGRNSMQPSLSLSYSGNIANGVLGDVQAPWVGMGWSIDTAEIARKITNGGCDPCGGGSYGYENKFLLLINGTGYELIPEFGGTPGRYHTKDESFLYIQHYNDVLGNPSTANTTGEWWEVVEKDGTRWRLGYTVGSEQLAAMKGYPGAASGAWVFLGYAGNEPNVVAGRWRADQVTDVYGNRMTFTYYEESRSVNGTAANYNQASYIDTIAYTSHTSGTPLPGYSVVFVRASRGGLDIPAPITEWDNWDTFLLDRIDVKHGTSTVRAYDLVHTVRPYTDDGKSWQTTTLTSLAISGGSTNAPTINFGYIDQPNRANCGVGCYEWAYPRLQTTNNGWGGATSYVYEHDGRPLTSWYNWRVNTFDVTDGVAGSQMIRSTFAYSTPCYNDSTAGWCNASNIGGLIGYGQTTATSKVMNGTTTFSIAVHKFHTDEEKPGREYEAQFQDASGTILSQTNTSFQTTGVAIAPGAVFTTPQYVEEFQRTTSGLVQVSVILYLYNWTSTGNLISETQYKGAGQFYKEVEYSYVTNMSPSVWILNTVSSRTITGSGGTVSRQEYGYNGNLPGAGSPTLNKPTLSRVVNGTQTIDTRYIYDTNGNVTTTRLFKNYGNTSSQPSGTYLTYLTGYDTTLKTYITSTDPPLIPATTMGYDFGLGLPTTATDPNGNTTTTTYDGLGRVLTVRYPGYAQGQENIKYTYPTPGGNPLSVSAPFKITMEVRDDTINGYRTAWQFMDGLGRLIQTQRPFETNGVLVMTDTYYNGLGLVRDSSLPRTLSWTGGTYNAPNWASVPYTTRTYDALRRPASILYPDGSDDTFTYSGLRTTIIDRNDHKKVHEKNAFGLLVKVEEYTGSGTYTLYATTTYDYNLAYDLLKQVTDAAGNQTILGYDGFGRKTSMTDPDMGAWTYSYSVLGNLTSQTDARNCVTTITYDDLNRPTGKTYTGPGACNTTPDVTYTYDATTGGNEGKGRRTGMSDSNSST
ncbi:MAG: hypothetical protein L0287_35755, partial [Anaerolineae bacterium]|nr:hypothetical protein [Anaerolineae bacterium]